MLNCKKIIKLFYSDINKLKILIFIIFAVFYCKTAFALNPNKKIHHYVLSKWQVEQGLPQNYIKAIIQTKDGYLWLGTEEGLTRFDGVSFKKINKRNNKAFKSNNIRVLFEDSKNQLWIGTSNGITVYSNGEYQHKPLTKNQNQNPNEIRTITEDKKGIIWLSTLKGGLYKYVNNKFDQIKLNENVSKKAIRALHFDSKNNLWIGTKKGLFKKAENEKTKHIIPNKDFTEAKFYTIYEDKNHVLWFGAYKTGLLKFENNKFTAFTKENGLLSNKIISITGDKDKNLWIGTYGDGLIRYANQKFSNITSKTGLLSDMILDVFEDSEGNLWVGTYKGLNRLKDGSLFTYTKEDGLAEDEVVAIMQDNRNRLLIGTWNSGLSIFDGKEFTNLTIENGLSSNVIKSLYEDSDKNIWVGTYGGGVNKYNGINFSYFNSENGLSGNNISSIIEDKNKNIWIGTFNNGLNLLKKDEIKVFTKKHGLKSNMIRALHIDLNNNLWIGTKEGGLNLFKNNEFTVYDTSNGLSNNTVYSIYEDKEKNLWIGTDDGLNLFKNNKFTVFNTTHGLFDDIALVILEDKQGFLWMSCNRGIYKVKKQDLLNIAEGIKNKAVSIVYGVDDGMKSRECNGGFQPAGLKDNTGKIYFPTVKGLVVADPDYELKNTIKPSVYIELVKVNGKTVHDRKKIILKPNINKIEFHYTALSYTSPKKVKFKYMLEGFDSDWVNAENRRTAYYTNLSDGNYTFKVKACNNDGVWNETGAVIKFKKLPYFYQSVWFILFTIALVILLIIIIHNLRLKKIEKKQKELLTFNITLKEQVELQTKKLKEKNKELDEANIKLNENKVELEQTNQQLENTLSDLTKTHEELKNTQGKLIQQARFVALGNLVGGVSHEISNPLSSVMGGTIYLKRYLEKTEKLFLDLSNEKDEENNFPKNHKRAVRSVQMLMEGHSRIRKIIDNFRGYMKSGDVPSEEYNIKEGTLLCFKLLDRRIEDQKIEVKIDISDEIPLIKCRPNELNQVITNLLINSLDVMPKGGKITIKSSVLNNNLEIMFSDTGPGIDKKNKESIFDPFFTTKPPSEGTGLGLYISSEIIKRHGGELLLQEKELGTSFLIKLPLNTA